jgi:hypothetical protein
MKDKILAMESGILIDSLIAEDVMGWKERVDFDVVDGMIARYIPNTNDVEQFSPSTDISAAWNVVEKLQPTLWVRMNSMMDEHYCGVGSPDMLWEYKSRSMPECICKAALLAVMES